MEMEVNVTKRVIKTVRGRGGKLTKKPVEMFFSYNVWLFYRL